MRIAVYSGSFDPLHIGHLAILERLSADPGFDCTYLVVSPQNPLKDASKAASGRARFEAAVAAVARHPGLKVKVDPIELEMVPPHYTIRTLDALREREPENVFTLVMGADNLAVIRRWKDWSRILSEYGAVVYPREGFDAARLRRNVLRSRQSGENFQIRLLDAPMVDISSTRIREGQALGEDMSAYLM